MNARILSGMAALVLSLGAAGQVQANIIYSNLGPGGTFNPATIYNVEGTAAPAFPGQVVAMQFTVPANSNYVFTNAMAGLSVVSGTNSIAMSLETDSAGVPGAILESFVINGAMGPFPPGSLVTANSGINPLLLAGTPYWLVVTAPVADTFAGWNLDSIGDVSSPTNAFAFNALGSATGPWNTDNGGSTRGAFEIDATPAAGTAVPEPLTMGLGMLGLAALALAGIRRRA